MSEKNVSRLCACCHQSGFIFDTNLAWRANAFPREWNNILEFWMVYMCVCVWFVFGMKSEPIERAIVRQRENRNENVLFRNHCFKRFHLLFIILQNVKTHRKQHKDHIVVTLCTYRKRYVCVYNNQNDSFHETSNKIHILTWTNSTIRSASVEKPRDESANNNNNNKITTQTQERWRMKKKS